VAIAASPAGASSFFEQAITELLMIKIRVNFFAKSDMCMPKNF
jgi:hypothetical protein